MQSYGSLIELKSFVAPFPVAESREPSAHSVLRQRLVAIPLLILITPETLVVPQISGRRCRKTTRCQLGFIRCGRDTTLSVESGVGDARGADVGTHFYINRCGPQVPRGSVAGGASGRAAAVGDSEELEPPGDRR